MEVLEKKKSKPRKKREKHEVTVESSPVASCSNNTNVPAELENAAKDFVEAEAVEVNPVESNQQDVCEVQSHIDKHNDVENPIVIQEQSNSSDQTSPEKLLAINRSIMNEIKCSEITKEAPIMKQKKLEPEQLLILNNSIINEIKFSELNEQLNAISCQQGDMKSEMTKVKAYSIAQLTALYNNTELSTIEQFTNDFVESELKGAALCKHPLYELVCSYLQVRRKVSNTDSEVAQLKRDFDDLSTQLWSLSTEVITARAQCLDGNTVVAKHAYTKAKFHYSALKSISRTMDKIRNCIYESHVLYSYSTEVARMQIGLYIHDVVTTLLKITHLPESAPVYLGMEQAPAHLLPHLSDLRLSISVLFHFQRKLIRDADFLKETRQWLDQLVSLLLRLATWQDHLFILSQVLRCPPGVGSWASCYIQVPLIDQLRETPFADYEINHTITILALILSPIQKRELFLQEIAQIKENEPVEALWTIVDSDGEEDEEISGTSLRENDLVSFLNQLPLDVLFRAVLLVEKRNNRDVYNSVKVTESHILRFFSFSTTLLSIFHKGLQTYNVGRYNQFCKRLSRFIRHIVQYASDQWEIYQTDANMRNDPMIERLQVEYDAFFLRAIYYLYTSEKLGAWQFLAVVPYGIITSATLWKIFYFLHQSDFSADSLLGSDDGDYARKIWEPMLREQFEEKLCRLDEAECYYLLNTFANMALARDVKDMDFIRTAMLDLLQVGFVSEATQDGCSKNARILLTHITSKHPHLLSDIFKSVKENMRKIDTLSLYLYEELPISVWQLNDDDIEMISNMLLQNPFNSTESKLSRMIISRLNWEFDGNEILFLPYQLHCDIAVLIVKAVELDSSYTHWAWQTSFRLRLHISDKGFADFNRVRDLEFYDVILKGVREQQPLASFLAVLLTSWGHLVPLICSRGFDQLLFLQTQQKHEAVLFALNLIVPLFVHCQETIINFEKFQNVILGLLNADRTYINIAKSLITTPSTVLQQFRNMILSHVVNYSTYGLNSPRLLVRLWVNSLVSVPNWNKDYGVMYLLDAITQASMQFSDAIDVIVLILRELLLCTTPQEQSNTISSLFKWVSQSNGPQNNLLINTSLSSCPYLAYIMIFVEFEEKEKSTGLWNEILLKLNEQKGKINVDQAIKKATSKLKLSGFSSGSLCFFRWAQQALDTPLEHPILVLLWQKFFTLYLYWIDSGNEVRVCVGDKFFEGMINFNFLKRMKKRLQETVQYYKGKTTDGDFKKCTTVKQLYYMSALKVFTAFSLWLEEPRLRDSTLYMPNLPPQYEPTLLNLVMQGSETPWLEYVDFEAIKLELNDCIRTWRCANYREKKNINRPLQCAGQSVESADPKERILRRLTSYDTPKHPPRLNRTESILPVIRLTDRKSMFGALAEHFKILLTHAHNNTINMADHKVLHKTYQEIVPQLYRSVARKIEKNVACNGSKTSGCTGEAKIRIHCEEAMLMDHIQSRIQENQNSQEYFMNTMLKPPGHNLCLAAIVIKHVIVLLKNLIQVHPEYSELGVDLFYHTLSLINEDTTGYLPTNKLFTQCLEKLGQTHICGNEYETVRLLGNILEDPSRGMYLVPHFSPISAGTANFLVMYSMISRSLGERYDLLYSLLSKFDVNSWLQRSTPKLKQRSQFIEHVMTSLLQLGFEPSEESLVVAELYRKHLVCIFEYEFPEHYGEVLMAILKASNGSDVDNISLNVWMDILNSLARPILLQLDKPMDDQLRQFAQHQKLLPHRELLQTSVLLCRHFTNERLEFGLYGLYPKARKYLDVITLFLGLVGHGLVISFLNYHPGMLSDELCEKLWPHLRDMFGPWLLPYYKDNFKENMANWIQQLTDDRTVLLPWIPSNSDLAQKVVNMFFKSVLFVIKMMPACNNIYSYVWYWYVTNFAHLSMKDYVLTVVNNAMLTLPWQNFWPSVQDLDLMLKVKEQYLPECHNLLENIFIEAPWISWMPRPPESQPGVYRCLLNLFVKISNEPKLAPAHAKKAHTLLSQAENFDWAIIDVVSLQQVLDWYIMSCDPIVLLKTDPMDIGVKVLQFLKSVCQYKSPLTHADSVREQKRLMFVRSYMKLLTVFTNRYKSSLTSKERELVAVFVSQLDQMEHVARTQQEISNLVQELLKFLNTNLKSAILDALIQWLGLEGRSELTINAFLSVLSSAAVDMDAAAVLYEVAIETYFKKYDGNTVDSPWTEIVSLLKTNCFKQNSLIELLISKDCVLTLHAILLQKMQQDPKPNSLLNLILKWLHDIKINEAVEAKVPLLWSNFLTCTINYEEDDGFTSARLHKFAQYLLQLSDQKDGIKWSGIFERIGIGKQSNAATLAFKFMSRAVAGYILAQLPEPKESPQTIRRLANSPKTVGQPGGSTEAPKVLLKLDFAQSQGKIKECAEQALKQIQDPNNSLQNINAFLSTLLHQFYSKPYLCDIK